jgi:hypothetical protein
MCLMMKVPLSLMILVSLQSAALAQAGGSTQDMTCSQAAGLVRARGAIVLHTSPTTYDRYVSSGASCLRDQMTDPAWVRTADTPQCFIGYRCRSTDLDNGR